MSESKLRIEVRIMTTLHGWTAPEHSTIEITETEIISLLRHKGWELPIHDVNVSKVDWIKVYQPEDIE